MDFLVDVVTDKGLTEQQQEALLYATDDSANIKNLEGYAGSGKSYTVSAIREVYEQAGFDCRGIALSGIVADNLGRDSNLEDSRTIASFLYQFDKGNIEINNKTVLFLDEASMVGTVDYSKIVSIVAENNAKLVTLGDDNQLQAIQAGGANRLVKEVSTSYTLDEIRRQNTPEDREATFNFSTGEQRNALEHYRDSESLNWHADKDEMLKSISENALEDMESGKSSIVLAHKRADVHQINEVVHKALKEKGSLGKSVDIGGKEFSEGERFIFLQNDNGIGVKNGTTGTLDAISESGEMQVSTDDGREINFNANDYEDFDRAYAVTIHKSQGVTVDSAQVFLDQDTNSHLALVGCSRHKDDLQIHVMEQSEQNEKGFNNFDELVNACEKSQAKTLISDYQNVLTEHVAGLNEVKVLVDAELSKDVLDRVQAEKAGVELDGQIKELQKNIETRAQEIKEGEMFHAEQSRSEQQDRSQQQSKPLEKERDIGGFEMDF